MLLNAVQCRKHLGIKSAATWTGWIKEPGFPPYQDGPDNNQMKLYDPDLVLLWMQENNKKNDATLASSPMREKLLAARTLKEQELAKLAQLKREVVEGKLVSKAKVEAANIKKFTYIRNKFASLPVRLAPLVVGRTAGEIQEIIDREIDDILVGLSKS